MGGSSHNDLHRLLKFDSVITDRQNISMSIGVSVPGNLRDIFVPFTRGSGEESKGQCLPQS